MAKATPQETELHQRLLSCEETASSELCMKYLDLLVNHFRRVYSRDRRCTSEMIYDAVTDALLKLIDDPSQYDPERLTLEGYLRMSAEGDLRNLLDKEKRRLRVVRPSQNESVELEAKARNMIDEKTENPEQEILDEEIDSYLRRLFDANQDYELAKLIISGVRETSDYAEILGIADLSKSEQRKIVKRAKDRIKVKLKRSNINKLLE